MIFFIFIYLVFCILLIHNWNKIHKINFENTTPSQSISLIIAFRNEENNILNLLKNIENQAFEKNKFEVILVNDNSTDESITKIVSYQKTSFLNLKIIENSGIGKKLAIENGVKNSQYETIVCTDADCQFHPNWLLNYSLFFKKHQPKFVFAGVKFISENSFSNNLLQLEFLSLVGTGASTWKMKMPTMCNGANIAFLKSTFYEVDGYKNIDQQPSGDDVFLMLKIFDKHPNDVYFLKNKDSIVETNSPNSWKEFYHQRLRWASKWGNYKEYKSKIIGFLVLFCYIDILFSITTFSYMNTVCKTSFLISILIKSILEYIFLDKIMKYNNEKMHLLPFIVLYLFYPFYLMYFAFAARFSTYFWKNRIIKN